jgi:hypothetical protein
MDERWAIYKGIKYSAALRLDGSILLRSTDERDIQNGFQTRDVRKDSPYKCFKTVSKNEVSEVYDIIVKAEYKGYMGDVLEENGDKVFIQIPNLLPEEAQRLQMEYATDPGIYVKWVPKSEVKLYTNKVKL